jgi:hypothetical protein
MYRFMRTATVKNAAHLPAAIQFGAELNGYLNKTYNINLRVGVEMFGGATLHWQLDAESLDSMNTLNTKMLQDQQYIGMLEKMKDIWVDGTLKDTIVAMLGP